MYTCVYEDVSMHVCMYCDVRTYICMYCDVRTYVCMYCTESIYCNFVHISIELEQQAVGWHSERQTFLVHTPYTCGRSKLCSRVYVRTNCTVYTVPMHGHTCLCVHANNTCATNTQHQTTTSTHSNSQHHSPTNLPAETLATTQSLDRMYLELQTPVRNFTVLEICKMDHAYHKRTHVHKHIGMRRHMQ